MSEPQIGHAAEVIYEEVADDYLEKRQLRKGSAGWLLMTMLGVSYVISGDFAGWNLGLARGGFGGMLLATLLMGAMYFAMVLTLAELSTSLPTAGGGYSFARRALGPWGGYLTGSAILLEYAIAPAAIAIFIGHYWKELYGFDGPWVYVAAYTLFVGLHLMGAGEALRIMMAITVLAIAALAVFAANALLHFDPANLLDVAVDDSAYGASRFLPHGYVGVWTAIPFAMWLFLAVEGVPLAAEEAIDPARDIPRGIIGAMIFLLVSAAAVLLLAPGAAGAKAMSEHGAPLVGALHTIHGSQSRSASFVNIAGLFGLIASFFAIIFAYSRQIFALSRAGYLPRFLSVTNSRKIPARALIIPGVIGLLLSFTGEGDLMINMAVFGATISYAMMMLAHMVLRRREPQLSRPYRTPGGAATSGFAFVLSLVALASTFAADPRAAAWCGGVYAILIAYFGLYSRRHLVAHAPEEEFAAIFQAQHELVSN